ncbi:phosphoserine phosphatase RsbU/P [Azospirillaceae bacterium]
MTKPVDRAELLARVQIHLENRALIRNLQQYRDRLEGELDVAREIFEHLLPLASDVAVLETALGLEIRPHMIQSSELGGDIWGVLNLGDRRLGVYLLDMAGRGVAAALNVCRLHSLVQELSSFAPHPARFLTELSASAHDLLVLGDHAVMIYGVIDVNAGSFTFASAAACKPLLIPGPGEAPVICEASGLPLGVTTRHDYEQYVVPFAAGASLLLFSNAVLDALDAGGDGHNAQQSLRDLVARTLESVEGPWAFQAVSKALATLVGDQPDDDHTLVWLSRPVA